MSVHCFEGNNSLVCRLAYYEGIDRKPNSYEVIGLTHLPFFKAINNKSN